MASTTEPAGRVASISRRPTANISSFASPTSPYTPILQRSGSSIYGSPGGGGFRSSDEDYIILEIGSRFLRAGFHGESSPRCTLTFGPSESRRLGDYRQWMPDYASKRKPSKRGKAWGSEYELWRMDLREVDLGLVEDKLERALREVYNKYFLLDKPRRILLSLPPLLPRQLLSAVLNVLFNHLQAPSVSLLTAPVLSTVAAGLRSALVVDIGWAETTVTAVYEYREMCQRRSIRAEKKLSRAMAKFLDREKAKQTSNADTSGQRSQASPTSFEEADDVICRLGWCKSRANAEDSDHKDEDPERKDESATLVSIPLGAGSICVTIEVPFLRLAEPAEVALFGTDAEIREIDAHDQPLHLLVYNTLLSLTVVTRDVCMARVIVTGGVSNLPGVKQRLVEEVKALIEERDWDQVRTYGSGIDQKSRILQERSNHQQAKPGAAPTKDSSSTELDGAQTNSRQPIAANAYELPDKAHATLVRETEREHIARRDGMVTGVVRCADSLGAWAGGSLLANLRIKGTVEIEKDKYLQHGLAGAGTGQEKVSAAHQRQSLQMGAGTRQSGGERNSGSLGVWA